MSLSHKSSVFKEMYMGVHWLMLLFVTVLHFQLMKGESLMAVILLIFYFAYVITEAYLYAYKHSLAMEHWLKGYFQCLVDLLFVGSLCLIYPRFHSVFMQLLQLFTLLFILTSSANRKILFGVLTATTYLVVSLLLQQALSVSALSLLFQTAMLLLFSIVVAGIDHLFDGVFQRNQFALKEIEYKNALLEKSSKTDFLTDLFNHQAFYQSLDRVTTQYAPVCLILYDIDNFKKVNDSFGHLAGDYVIREVAQIMKSHLRESDVAARYGGEEFAILLPGANCQTGSQVAERIRTAVANHAFVLDGVQLPVTISGGVGMSSIHLKKHEQSQFVDLVDELLYDAKRSGKNRIAIQHQISAFNGAD